MPGKGSYQTSLSYSIHLSAMADEYEYDFLIDLLTYNCPITGKKRCAAAASLENPNMPNMKKLVLLN